MNVAKAHEALVVGEKCRGILFGKLVQEQTVVFVRGGKKGVGIPPTLTFPLPTINWHQQLIFSAALRSLRFLLKLQGNQ